MPVTELQRTICRILAENRSEDSYLAGGAALHFAPNSKRFSNDLDFFHDSVERVAQCFTQDSALLAKNGFKLTVEMNQPGYIRAVVSSRDTSTKIEWAHDSAWRFLPTILSPDSGYQLHPIDLAINKILALAGRDEPRDFLDTLEVNRITLPLGALIWAACGKDPGFTPVSLLELIKRRGRYQPEAFSRLLLTEPVDLNRLKEEWLTALTEAEQFIEERDPSELGCLYYDDKSSSFVAPKAGALPKGISLHFGRPGGVLPGPARK